MTGGNGAGSRATVIVADDDPAIRFVCRINRELEGYRVVEAANATETRECIRKTDDAVVLLDSRLGPDDGAALAREVRSGRPDVGIAVMTADWRVDDAAVGLPAAKVIRKPFRPEHLLDAVRGLACR